MGLDQAARVGGAGMLALVATYGLGRQAYGLFVPTFREEFALPLDVLGFYASAAQAGYLVATVVTGFLAARYGPRLPVVLGSLLLAVGATLTASAPGPVLLGVGVIAAGTSAGGAWAPFSDAVRDQVPVSGARRALALVNAGSPVGLMVASVLVLAAGEVWRLAWLGFAIVGLMAATVSWKVLTPVTRSRPQDGELEEDSLGARSLRAQPTVGERAPLRLGWFVNARSVRLFLVTLGVSITSGAYFAYAPDTAQDAGLAAWTGPAMWAVLGLAGAGVGVFAGGIANRYGLRRPLAISLLLVGASMLALQAVPGSLPGALGSAALFGIGFTVGFALLVMWSQQVFADRPTTGFTVAIVCIAAGFIAGPSLFGLLATHLDRTAALLISATPALLAAALPPAPVDRGARSRAARSRARRQRPTH